MELPYSRTVATRMERAKLLPPTSYMRTTDEALGDRFTAEYIREHPVIEVIYDEMDKLGQDSASWQMRFPGDRLVITFRDYQGPPDFNTLKRLLTLYGHTTVHRSGPNVVINVRIPTENRREELSRALLLLAQENSL